MTFAVSVIALGKRGLETGYEARQTSGFSHIDWKTANASTARTPGLAVLHATILTNLWCVTTSPMMPGALHATPQRRRPKQYRRSRPRQNLVQWQLPNA